MLKGKHIVLGITGSIAAYKAAILARLLIKKGAEVQVVITPAGKEFITPITLSALTSKPVISEFFSNRDGTWNSHVDIGLWADAMLIAPASAATIGKMAHGIADNMLITTYLSMKAPVFIAPAMDLDMYAHPTTTDNLSLLANRGNHIIDSASGFLASHLEGKGRMQEPEYIVAELESFFDKKQDLKGTKILITAGGTQEAIDPVRFLGNHSTGKMGICLAEACAERGAEVILVLGTSSIKLKDSSHISTIKVTSALEMYKACSEHIDSCEIALFSAAVADYRVAEVSNEKIKRERSDSMQLNLIKNPDIAAEMGLRKRKEQYFVCFALETDNGEQEALRKMKAKGMNAVVLNSLQDKGAGFANSTNKVTLFDNKGRKQIGELKSKELVAHDIIDFILEKGE